MKDKTPKWEGGKQNTARKMRQVKKIELSTTVMRPSGIKAIAIVIPEAFIYIPFSDPNELSALSKALDIAARDLLQAQRPGAGLLSLPSNGYSKNYPELGFRDESKRKLRL